MDRIALCVQPLAVIMLLASCTGVRVKTAHTPEGRGYALDCATADQCAKKAARLCRPTYRTVDRTDAEDAPDKRYHWTIACGAPVPETEPVPYETPNTTARHAFKPGAMREDGAEQPGANQAPFAIQHPTPPMPSPEANESKASGLAPVGPPVTSAQEPTPPQPVATAEPQQSSPKSIAPGWFLERPTPPPKHLSADPSLPATRVYEIASESVFTIAVLDVSAKGTQFVGHGSAVAVSPEYLITNWHVAKAGNGLVVLRGSDRATVQVYAADVKRDLCWVRVVSPGVKLHPVKGTRPFDSLRIGETVYSLGTPLHEESTFAAGVISGKRQGFYVQTSAPISPGSSGGGLFDAQGNLVGITKGSLEDGQALNFAIRADAFWETGQPDSNQVGVHVKH